METIWPGSTKAKVATPTSRMKKKNRKLDRAAWRWSNGVPLMVACPLQTTTLLPSSLGSTKVFWSTLEHLGREEQGRTWCMDAAQPHMHRTKEEVILKSARPPTRPSGRVPQLDRPSSTRSS
ncbi:unnamed protein product [Microthlaspi erraticum]|uniref:Uncharacterized protein n=1 Tax=Microthlaspi erraticum TaxID=1685480 RepID=A0A6D2KDR3_9BRAS|nr:unnamed protein product [Microthlaspi erraticum]